MEKLAIGFCALILALAIIAIVWFATVQYNEADACRARGGEPTYDSVTGVHCFNKSIMLRE